MIISDFDPASLGAAFGIDMSSVEGGAGAGWGRVRPGHSSDPHQHDEIETFVIVRGSGEVVVDGRGHPVRTGTVVQFEPFETHVITNTGDTDLVFADFYWRDPARAAEAAARPDRRRVGQRPLFVFSTPPTPNGDLHLGHLSGPYLGADVFVRFQRLNGAQAWHLTGSDDYQSYVRGAAERDGRSPAETAAHYSAEIAETLRLMDIEPDQYTATDAEPGYADGLRAFFSALVSSGAVAPRHTPALVDGGTGAYLYEAAAAGGCPGCKQPTSGNICEECGEPNTCADLVEPSAPGSAVTPEVAGHTRFALPLHEFREVVQEHHHLGRVPARLRELADRVFARGPLDLPVTHPSSWGVAPAEDAVPDQVIWVWPEMAYGFLHGIAALGARLGQDWRALEPDPDWKIVHFFGYDNSFYHSLLYPVLYRLAFPRWRPDIDYHVNEFYLLEGEKFSTSRRHAVWGKDVLSPATVDSVRYFLARTRPEGRRTNFERHAYEATVRETLVGTWQHWLTDLGTRVAAQHGGRVPDAGTWRPEHTAFLARLGLRLAAVTAALGQDGFSLNQAAEELDGIVTDTLRFSRAERLAGGLPGWSSEARTALALELAAARLLADCAAPVLPRFATRLSTALGLPPAETWPRLVELVPVGSEVTLADAVFFTEPGSPA